MDNLSNTIVSNEFIKNKNIDQTTSHQALIHPKLFRDLRSVTKEPRRKMSEMIKICNEDLDEFQEEKVYKVHNQKNLLTSLNRIGIEPEDSYKYYVKYFNNKNGVLENPLNKGVIDFLFNIPEKKHPTMYLFGISGSGKTHLFKTHAKKILSSNEYSVGLYDYATSINQLSLLEKNFKESSRYQELIQPFLNLKFLFLDGMNLDVVNSTHQNVLIKILKHRLNKKLKTYINSNVAPSELAATLGTTVVSTIKDCCITRQLHCEIDYRDC